MKVKGLVANWDFGGLTPASIEKATEEIIKKYEAAFAAIGQIKAEDVTFDNTIKALIDLEREMITEDGPLYFPQHVVTDKTIRLESFRFSFLNTFSLKRVVQILIADSLFGRMECKACV